MSDTRRRVGDDWRKLVVRYFGLTLLTSGWLGFSVALFLVPLIGKGWSLVLFFSMYALFLGVFLGYRRGRWSNENLEKGWPGERRVGEVIERAITARGCAVAHGVEEVADIGDIDHLVATPVCLWVVEAQYRWLRDDTFTEALRRLERNMETIATIFPQTPLKGCLVLAYEEEKEVKRRRYDDGRIVVHEPESLLEALQSEAQQELTLDPAVTKRIGELALSGESDERGR